MKNKLRNSLILSLILIVAFVVMAAAAPPSKWDECKPETHNVEKCRDTAMDYKGVQGPEDGDWYGWAKGAPNPLSECTSQGVRGFFGPDCDIAPTATSTVEVTPTATSTIEVTPTATSTVEVTPTATSTIEVTPTATSTIEVTPTATSTVEVTPTDESDGGPAEYKLNFDSSVFPSLQGVYVLREYIPGSGLGAVLDIQFLPGGWYDTSCRKTIYIGRALNVIVEYYEVSLELFNTLPQDHWAEWLASLDVTPERLEIINPVSGTDYSWVDPAGGCNAIEVTTDRYFDPSVSITDEFIAHLEQLRTQRLEGAHN